MKDTFSKAYSSDNTRHKSPINNRPTIQQMLGVVFLDILVLFIYLSEP